MRHLALAWGIALAINVVPAFMPPTWSVMAAIRIMAGLPLLPLTVGGALMSGCGRLILAEGSRRLGRSLPEQGRQNATAVGDAMTRHPRWQLLTIFVVCLTPFPSNALFIASGVGRLPLPRVVLAFVLSRSIADTFWVWAAGRVARSLPDTLTAQFRSPVGIALQVLSVGLVVLLLRLPWARWLHRG
jgi:hypothetical protein